MNTLVILVAAVIAAVAAAAPQKEAAIKPFSYNSGFQPANQGFYPGQQAYYPGYQGYNPGYRGGAYYPGYQGYQGYYPGYQGYTGYQGYSGYQGYYPGYQGYQGYNRGYYQPAAVAPTAVYPSVTPAPAVAAPKVSVPVYKPVDNRSPAIVSQSQEVNFDGNFNYGYETENGISARALGYLKNAGTEGAAQVIEGSYAYVGNDGAPVEVKYYADDTGYHAVGNVVPTTPPEIARSLEYTASQPQKPEDSKRK